MNEFNENNFIKKCQQNMSFVEKMKLTCRITVRDIFMFFVGFTISTTLCFMLYCLITHAFIKMERMYYFNSTYKIEPTEK